MRARIFFRACVTVAVAVPTHPPKAAGGATPVVTRPLVRRSSPLPPPVESFFFLVGGLKVTILFSRRPPRHEILTRLWRRLASTWTPGGDGHNAPSQRS